MLTNPAKLRSEEEHELCRSEAREILDAIRRRFILGVDYDESESSGRLYAPPLR